MEQIYKVFIIPKSIYFFNLNFTYILIFDVNSIIRYVSVINSQLNSIVLLFV